MCTNDEHSTDDQISAHPTYDQLSRRELRTLMFYLLYAMDACEYRESLLSIVDNFNRGFELSIPFDSEAVTIVESVVKEREQLDLQLAPLLANWRLERVGLCTKLILRLATWELEHTTTPATIVINEAIELAKCFAEKDAYRFVNGVLDEFVKLKEAS